MSDAPGGPPPKTGGERRRLDSWKEIAAYLGRGIRTVQRWERDEGLPVHRLAHAERGSVFADPAELTDWWKSRQIAPVVKPSLAGDTVPEPRLQRVTGTTAATFSPALSSDARMVVYVSDAGQDGTTPQVWLQQVGGAAVQLTTGMRECAEPTFSADDTRVIFTAAGDVWFGAELVCRSRHAKRDAAPAAVVPRSPIVEPPSLARCPVAGVRRHAAWWISHRAGRAPRRRSCGR